MSRPAPPTGIQPGDGKGVAKFKRRISPEQRERLSEVATERHRQSEGRGFSRGLTKPGSKKPQRKPSKTRVARMVAEAAREKQTAQAVIDVFKDGISNTQPMHIRLKAAEALLKVESDDAKLRLQEEENASIQRGRGELLELLAGKLSNGPTGMLLRKQLMEQPSSDIIDVDPEEVEDVIDDESGQ